MSDPTIRSIKALTNIFVLEELPAWNPQFRSSIPIRSSPVRNMVDPSPAMAALRAGPGDLLKDMKTFSFLFESLAIRDLRVCAQGLEGDACHYRDANGLEADAVVYLHDGRWGAPEVKMEAAFHDQAAENLLKLSERIDQSSMNPPFFFMILTADAIAYRREDGVLVVPLGCLVP